MFLKKEIIEYYNNFTKKSLPTEMWNDFLVGIRNHILNDEDFDFFSWGEVRQTMYAGHYTSGMSGIMLKILQIEDTWPIWNKVIVEETFGLSGPTILPNKVNHSYYLNMFLKFTKLKIEEIPFVFEFGAGFGNMCSIFSKLGYDKDYLLYDFPELLTIQHFYLKANNVKCNIIQECDIEKLSQLVNDNGVFISTHAIEESPEKVIEKIFSIISNFKYFLFTFSGKRGEIINFCEKNSIKYNESEIPCCNGSYILVGER